MVERPTLLLQEKYNPFPDEFALTQRFKGDVSAGKFFVYQ